MGNIGEGHELQLNGPGVVALHSVWKSLGDDLAASNMQMPGVPGVMRLLRNFANEDWDRQWQALG